MKFTLDRPGVAHLVRAYAPGLVRIGDRDIASSVIVSAAILIEPWRPRHAGDLAAADLEPAIALAPEVLLIGTGLYVVLNAIALFVLAVYAMAWRITARITGRRWMDGVSALTVVSLFAVALALGTTASWLAYAGALVLSGVLPGLYMMRMARAAQG